MPEPEIRNPKSEFRKSGRGADVVVGLSASSARANLAGLLARMRDFWCACTQAATRGGIRFQKYRVAPRLGTDTVRRRLLFRLDQNAPLAATETGLA